MNLYLQLCDSNLKNIFRASGRQIEYKIILIVWGLWCVYMPLIMHLSCYQINWIGTGDLEIIYCNKIGDFRFFCMFLFSVFIVTQIGSLCDSRCPSGKVLC